MTFLIVTSRASSPLSGLAEALGPLQPVQAIDPVRTSKAVKARLRPILLAAREQDAYVHIDMEQSSYKDLTQQIFREV